LPDADRSALPWKTIVADVDVKIARIDAVSGLRAHRDIAKTGGVPTTNTQIAPLTLTSGFISILPFRFPPRVDSATPCLEEASTIAAVNVLSVIQTIRNQRTIAPCGSIGP